MNTKLFKSIMVLNGDNIKSLASKMNISRQTLSLKIDGISEFKPSEIFTISQNYNLSINDVYEIFFKGFDSNECA